MSDQSLTIPKTQLPTIQQEVQNEKPHTFTFAPPQMPQLPNAKDEEVKKVSVALNGKMIWSDNSAMIGNNYKTLKNMRYTDTHPKSITGMTKINSAAAATSKLIDVVHHFSKARMELLTADAKNPESHVLMHVSDGSSSSLIVNKTAIPNTGNFEATSVFDDPSICTETYVSDAPGGCVAYCNGKENYIWGGDESPISAFVTSTATITTLPTTPKEYTDRMLNTLTDSENIVTIGGGADTATKSLLHFDGADEGTTITDNGSLGGTWTAVNAKLDVDYKEFGSASLICDGTGDYVERADDAAFFLDDNDFTIEARVKRAVAGVYHYICGQCNASITASTASFVLYFTSGNMLTGTVWSGSTAYTAAMTTAMTDTTSFHHVALVRSGTKLYVYLDGVRGATVATFPAASTAVNNATNKISVGRAGEYASYNFNGHIDEFRFSNGIARWTDASFTVPSGPYSATANDFLIGSLRPLQGANFYVSRGNATSATLAVKEWNGSTFTTLDTTTVGSGADGTNGLANSGRIYWPSTVNTSKVKYMCGYFIYWYTFTLSAGEADIYYVTVDAPMQPIVDLWDGLERSCVRCYYSDNGVYLDNSDNIYSADYYDTDTLSYLAIASMAYADDSILCGFVERISALNIEMPTDGKVNTNSVTATVHYCTGGTSFTAIAGSQDTTSVGGKTLAKTGTISWTSPAAGLEVTSDLGIDTIPLYWYKLTFSANVAATTRIDAITGIPAQVDMRKYKFPMMAIDSLFLCSEVNGAKNRLIHSVMGTSQVFNGTSVYEIDFGDDKELTGGCVLYSQFGSSIFNLVMIFKATETWALLKNTDDSWTRYVIDSNVGLAAPRTLKTATLPLETATGLNRNLGIWQSVSGIYLSDGRSPIPVHKDIESVFDRNSSMYIHPSYLDKSTGFVDQYRLEYHWMFASNSSSAGELDKELVFDLRRWKWYEVDRDTGKYLQIGCTVKDSDNNLYNYGVIADGYLERLEYGTTFDGNNIVSEFQVGSMPLSGDVLTETTVIKSVLTLASKANTANNVAMTHYVDGNSSGVSYSFDPTADTAGKEILTRVANPASEEPSGLFHTSHMSMTTNDETIGFEPLHFSYYVREDRNISKDKA